VEDISIMQRHWLVQLKSRLAYLVDHDLENHYGIESDSARPRMDGDGELYNHLEIITYMLGQQQQKCIIDVQHVHIRQDLHFTLMKHL
jgi:hypothetical protein